MTGPTWDVIVVGAGNAGMCAADEGADFRNSTSAKYGRRAGSSAAG